MIIKDTAITKIKVGLVSESGGHYTQMVLLREAMSDFSYFYITRYSEITRKLENSYIFKDMPHRSNIDYLKICCYYIVIFFKSIKILHDEKPNVLVSTGGGLPVPVFYAGKLLGIKLIHIEPSTKYRYPSWTGRLIYPIVDKIFVQNPELLQAYGNKAEYHGGLL
jgi:UDP-N-acetylglucosamine:LPS N-acetylglucosamine transferase